MKQEFRLIMIFFNNFVSLAYLHKGAEGAHELWQVPTLQQRRLELEGNREESDGDVSHGQVGDEAVGGTALHASAGHDDPDHQRVAHHRNHRNGAVADGQQHDHRRRHLVQIIVLVLCILTLDRPVGRTQTLPLGRIHFCTTHPALCGQKEFGVNKSSQCGT